jgi:protein-S-isoprenylcysteine O-methyltransferase Ste14
MGEVKPMSRLKLALSSLAFTAAAAAILFGAAGRWDLPIFWAYLTVLLLTLLHVAFTADLDLVRERLRPGPGGRDNLAVLRLLALLVLGGHWALAGLDVGRYHWSDTIPMAARIAGLVGLAVALALVRWAQNVNRFFSTAVRIQSERGHHVITTGPYRFVRHPGYVAFILGTLSSGFALGSWLALLLTALMVPRFVRRAVVEDRMLRRELEGYAEYAGKVRYRLVPGVW